MVMLRSGTFGLRLGYVLEFCGLGLGLICITVCGDQTAADQSSQIHDTHSSLQKRLFLSRPVRMRDDKRQS